MITFIILAIITTIVLGLAFMLISIGGSIFLILGADLIVAVGIIWLLFKLLKQKKK